MKSRQGSITSLMNKIMSNPEISKENKVYAQEMLAFMQASGAKINTVLKHLYCFEKYIVVIGRNIDAKNASRTKDNTSSFIGGITVSITLIPHFRPHTCTHFRA